MERVSIAKGLSKLYVLLAFPQNISVQHKQQKPTAEADWFPSNRRILGFEWYKESNWYQLKNACMSIINNHTQQEHQNDIEWPKNIILK